MGQFLVDQEFKTKLCTLYNAKHTVLRFCYLVICSAYFRGQLGGGGGGEDLVGRPDQVHPELFWVTFSILETVICNSTE